MVTVLQLGWLVWGLVGRGGVSRCALCSNGLIYAAAMSLLVELQPARRSACRPMWRVEPRRDRE
jgi:hypothetical protein